ncbi:hypothetical protein [Streptomyces hygroscopicus]|uniref:hypothetical protein n=1 Tax=Streptomyces hygroscopicus TaxID=1912 RepID=UPI003F1B977B
MYLQGVNFGDTEYKLAVSELARMGRSICCTFRIKTSSDGDADPDGIQSGVR